MAILKNIIKVIVAGGMSVVLLSAFCMVYLNTGIHIYNETGATDYKWESNQKKSSMVEGFAWLTMDENGFNNVYPKQESIDILLMGSSHMEALNVQSEKNTGYLLNEMMPDYYTYNIGMSGHTIYACANNLKAAIEYYHPKEYIIVETDRIELDIKSMEEILNGEYRSIKSYDTGFIYLVQKYLPLAKNLYKQVDDWKKADAKLLKQKKIVTVSVEKDEITTISDYDITLDRFLGFMRDGGANCKMMIVYKPETKLNLDGSIKKEYGDEKRAVFAKLCEKNDIMFVDATSAFEELYSERYILAHGFFNTAVGSGHLNEYGHRAFAETIVQAIKEAQ